ncbi:MAG: ferritin family protein [Desulfuromonadales bacterium]
MRRFLSDCHKIENLAGEMYQRLAIDGSYAPEVRQLFHLLSKDERTHARELDLAMQVPKLELDAVGYVSREILDAALRLAEEMVRTLDSRRLSEEEALRLAVAMEQQFLKVHVNNAVHFYNKKVAALFDELGRQDQVYLDRLRKCLTWWHSERRQQLDNC